MIFETMLVSNHVPGSTSLQYAHALTCISTRIYITAMRRSFIWHSYVISFQSLFKLIFTPVYISATHTYRSKYLYNVIIYVTSVQPNQWTRIDILVLQSTVINVIQPLKVKCTKILEITRMAPNAWCFNNFHVHRCNFQISIIQIEAYHIKCIYLLIFKFNVLNL